MQTEYQIKLLNIFEEKIHNLDTTKSFYKYLDIEGGKKALVRNTLQFSNPLSFEDIKECRSLRLNINFESLLDRVKFVSKLIIKDSSDIVKFSKRITDEDFSNLNEFIDNKFIDRYGICCLSTQSNNQYLWNYENIKHNGICLEYDAILLRKFLRTELKVNNNFHLLCPAIYLEAIEKVDFDIDKYILLTVLNWFFVKELNPYSNEHEVRIVSNFEHHYDKKYSFVSLTDEVLKNVYVGKCVIDSDYQVIKCVIDKNFDSKVGLIRV